MNRPSKRIKQVATVLLLVPVVLAGIWGWGFAEDAIKILPIKPVPGLSEGVPEPILSGRGVIQLIDGKEMVIGDIRLRLLNETAYFHSDGTPAIYTEFFVGNVVGYRLNAKRQIVELWALDVKP